MINSAARTPSPRFRVDSTPPYTEAPASPGYIYSAPVLRRHSFLTRPQNWVRFVQAKFLLLPYRDDYDAGMRTTLEIDDDVMDAARELARLKNQGIGRAISDLARRGLTPDASPATEMQFGVPVWKPAPGAVAVTSEMVRNLAEDDSV